MSTNAEEIGDTTQQPGDGKETPKLLTPEDNTTRTRSQSQSSRHSRTSSRGQLNEDDNQLPTRLRLMVQQQYSSLEVVNDITDDLESPSHNLEELKDALSQLDELMAEFQRNHQDIIDSWPAKLSDHPYFQGDVFLRMKRSVSAARRKISRLIGDLPTAVSSTLNPTLGAALPHLSKLPAIKLPTFTGDYLQWPNFQELFTSIVLDNANLKDVEKMHYLTGSLQGAPTKLISSLPVTGGSLGAAWDTLKARYDNPRLLVESQVERLFNLPTSAKSAEALEKVVNTLGEVRRTLGRLPVESVGDAMLVYIGTRSLDRSIRQEWETSLGSSPDFPSFAKFEDYLTGRARAQERVEVPKSTQPVRKHQAHIASTASSRGTGSSKTTEYAHSAVAHGCDQCGESHFLVACPHFRNMSLKERLAVVQNARLCYNCLGRHNAKDCRSTLNCKTCAKRHHTMLHEDFGAVISSAHAHNLKSAHSATALLGTTLLGTAYAKVSTEVTTHHVRMLIDSGSELTFISNHTVRTLNIPRQPGTLIINGIGGKRSAQTLGTVQVKLTSLYSEEFIFIRAHILEKLTTFTPSTLVNQRSWSHLRSLNLADPHYYRPQSIDVIIGADYYGSIIKDHLIKAKANAPVAQLTIFGWIIVGPTSSNNHHASHAHHTTIQLEDKLDDILTKFWLQEEVPLSRTNMLTKEEEECEAHFKATHTRDSSGRYIVRLPLIKDRSALGNSQWIASKCLRRMRARLNRDSQYGQLYSEFMEEYVALGHMKKVDVHPSLSKIDENHQAPTTYYLPHHGVLKPDSTTTKLRVVFNGSASTSSGYSLNDIMHTGANLLLNIMDVLIWVRHHKHVFATDITKMYRQIKVHQDDWDLQRIMWFDPYQKEVPYQLTTVTYGTRAAPFLATRTILQLIEDEGKNFPLAIAPLTYGRYVDDIFGGADTLPELHETAHQVRDLCNAGGFPLAKWHSTDPNLLEEFSSRTGSNEISFDDCNTKLLGLFWNPHKDVFSFSSKFSSAPKKLTKRLVASEVAQIFDPLGFLSPVVITAKIFLQELWSVQLSWDDPLPTYLTSRWLAIRSQLNSLANVSVPRWFGALSSSIVELHGFSDASQLAMASCVYMTIGSPSTGSVVSLICSKTKVAPLKKLTIPRLELAAALMLAKLIRHLKATLQMPIKATHLWTDSKVSLAWINSHPSRWKDFVRNRVTQIQELAPNSTWRHVPGTDNPADCASRGVTSEQLITHPLWWNGPQWITQDRTSWPDQPELYSQEVEAEANPKSVLVATTVQPTYSWDLIHQYSSIQKLINITALCLNLSAKIKKEHLKPPATLETEDIHKATQFWVRETQRVFFNEELKLLTKGSAQFSSNHAFSKLTAFLDKEGIIRVGGRLNELDISYEEKHPAILPRHSTFTQLIIREAHQTTLHGGTQLTLSRIRQRYWIIGGRQPVRSHILKCVTCARQRGMRAQQLMGQLPKARITPSKPFAHTGVDYAGPIHLKAWKGRCSKTHKGWICVFICFSSSATHLELVSDYTTDAFLSAYRRFAGRRGIAQVLYSDCGTNFIGADAELKKLFIKSTAEHKEISSSLTAQGTTWKFNPPAAPHMGGLWEAAVKSTKYHLKRTVKDTLLTYEEYATLLTQIEATLNSRPLEPLSDDPNDVSALTPGHFLIGAALNTVPEPSLLDLSTPRLSRWQLIQQKVQQFWSSWSAHHLQRQQAISKWHHPSNIIQVGSLVLIVDERSPPGKWPLARVLELHPGKDGLTRVVTLKTSTSTLMRPITKLSLLNLSDTSTTG